MATHVWMGMITYEYLYKDNTEKNYRRQIDRHTSLPGNTCLDEVYEDKGEGDDDQEDGPVPVDAPGRVGGLVQPAWQLKTIQFYFIIFNHRKKILSKKNKEFQIKYLQMRIN